MDSVIAKISKREPKQYNLLYYWIRVVVRYRAGIGIIGFGYHQTAAYADALPVTRDC
jgi:hypothetical protein